MTFPLIPKAEIFRSRPTTTKPLKTSAAHWHSARCWCVYVVYAVIFFDLFASVCGSLSSHKQIRKQAPCSALTRRSTLHCFDARGFDAKTEMHSDGIRFGLSFAYEMQMRIHRIAKLNVSTSEACAVSGEIKRFSRIRWTILCLRRKIVISWPEIDLIKDGSIEKKYSFHHKHRKRWRHFDRMKRKTII